MKKKISRILGVALTLALLSSLAIVSAPVSAGTQAWSTFATPSATGLVLNAGDTWTGPMVMDKDGTAIYAATNLDVSSPLDGTGDGAVLVKSTDGGRTWARLAGFTYTIAGTPGTFTDIVCSSIDANTVYVTDGVTIWKSINGGTTWAPLSSLFTSLVLTPGLAGSGYIVSLDVGYLGTSPYIFAGLSAFGAGLVGGGAYVCEEAVWGMPWSDLIIGTDRPVAFGGAALADVTEIRVDPVNFATTQMVMAVVTDRTATTTLISSKYGGAQWDSIVNDVNLPGVASALYTASLWLPDDFSSSLTSGLMQAFVGVDPMTAAEGDVFLAVFAVPAGPATAAFDLNVSGGVAVATHVSGLDGFGSAAGASMLASGSTETLPTVPRVFRSSPGGFTWLGDTKAPTGGATTLGIPRALPSILVLDASTALVATHGTDAGVHITNDYGATWNGISLLNATITSIDDLELGSVFMATSGANDAVWRHDGNWERVFSGSIFANATTSFLVQQSPAGDAVFVADLGGVNIWRSTDNGQTWMLQVNNITSTGPGSGLIGAFVAIDANTVVVGDGNVVNTNTVYTTTTNGGFWFTRVCTVGGTVTSLARDAGTGDLLAAGTGATVRRSQNQGISWSATAAVPFTGVNYVLAAFSSDYAANETIYATGSDTDGDAGIYKYDYSAAVPAWSRIDGGGVTADVAIGTGLVAAPAITGVAGAEMVYAADGTAAEGVSRVRQPRTVAEQMADATSTFMGLWYEPGSNKLYTVDTAAPRVRTYTDTLNVSGTGVAVSAITTTTATVSWNTLANAATYRLVVNTTAQTNFYTAVSLTAPVSFTGPSVTLIGLTPGVTYFVSVWAETPVSSYLFESAAEEFTTLPAPPIAPANLVPANGAINIPILGPAFAWAPPTGVPGITGYNWELSEDPLFGSFVGQEYLTVPYYVFPGSLNYETDYYWRVQAVTATGVSTWVTSVFTTVAEPEPPITVEPPPTPTIILPTPTVTVIPPDVVVTVIPPDITVDIPTPTTTIIQPVIEMPEEVTPMYIWAIVAIGALLVIAVIILIIRTRRVV